MTAIVHFYLPVCSCAERYCRFIYFLPSRMSCNKCTIANKDSLPTLLTLQETKKKRDQRVKYCCDSWSHYIFLHCRRKREGVQQCAKRVFFCFVIQQTPNTRGRYCSSGSKGHNNAISVCPSLRPAVWNSHHNFIWLWHGVIVSAVCFHTQVHTLDGSNQNTNCRLY